MHFVSRVRMKNRFRERLNHIDPELKNQVDDYAYNVIFSAKLETKETFSGILINICKLWEV